MPSSRDAESPAGPSMKAFQDYYPDESAHCYGCGRLNEHGLHIHSFWDGAGTAAAAAYRTEGRTMDTLPPHRFVTAALRVDYVKPTPLGVELEVRGRGREEKGRKVAVEGTVSAGGVITERGEVVAVEVPGTMAPRAPA